MSYRDVGNAIGIRIILISLLRKALIEALIERYRDYFFGLIDRIAASRKNCAGKLRDSVGLFEATLKEGAHDRACPIGMLAAEVRTLSEVAAERVHEFYSQNNKRLASILENGKRDGSLRFDTSTRGLAGTIFAFLAGALLVTRGHDGLRHFREMADSLFALLENRILSPGFILYLSKGRHKEVAFPCALIIASHVKMAIRLKGASMSTQSSTIARSCTISWRRNPNGMVRRRDHSQSFQSRAGSCRVSHEPGNEPPLHGHKNEDEWFYVLDGEMKFHVGGETHQGKTGAFVFFPREIPHTFTIESPTARFLLMNTPGGFEHMFELAPKTLEDAVRALKAHDIEVVGPHPRRALAARAVFSKGTAEACANETNSKPTWHKLSKACRRSNRVPSS